MDTADNVRLEVTADPENRNIPGWPGMSPALYIKGILTDVAGHRSKVMDIKCLNPKGQHQLRKGSTYNVRIESKKKPGGKPEVYLRNINKAL
jgi:hypothetical protein